eukprot:1787114-Karenia_brevis.AAC.1
MSTTLAISTSLSASRLRSAIHTLQRISRLPHPKEVKLHFAIVCGHSKGLYGCESSHVDEQLLRQYTSLMLNIAGGSNQLHARRVSILRRLLNKNSHLKALVSEIYDFYAAMQYPGVHQP